MDLPVHDDDDNCIHRRFIVSRDWASLRGMLNSEDSSSERFASTNFCVPDDDLPDGFNAMHQICWEQDVPPVDILTTILEIDESNLSRKTDTPSKATPLHLVCENSEHLVSEFVRALLALKPDAAMQLISEKDGRGMTPLDVLWLRFIDPGYQNYVGEHDSWDDGQIIATIAKFPNPDGEAMLRRGVQDMWDNTLHMFFAVTSCRNTAPPAAWSVVQSIASTEVRCPNLVMWFALLLHPEQVRWQDKDGNFPLHMAASCRNHYRYPILPFGVERNDLVSLLDSWENEETAKLAKSTMDEIQTSPVRKLAEIYPEAASIANTDGRYPIHLAADRGADWADEIEPLLAAAPRTLNKRDPKTALLPFMMAAVELEKEASVDVVYKLLRANPANVKDGIRNTCFEDYLENKLEESKRGNAEKDGIIADLRSKLKKRKAEI